MKNLLDRNGYIEALIKRHVEDEIKATEIIIRLRGDASVINSNRVFDWPYPTQNARDAQDIK